MHHLPLPITLEEVTQEEDIITEIIVKSNITRVTRHMVWLSVQSVAIAFTTVGVQFVNEAPVLR